MGAQFLLDIVNLLRSGLSPTQICVKLNITKQTLNYHLASLKRLNIIEKIGYGVWVVNEIEVKNIKLPCLPPTPHLKVKKVKEIRGHAFIWKVRIREKYNWKELLNSKQINYDEVGIQKTPRIILNGRKIWLGKENIIIYEKSSYFAQNAIESLKLAIYSLLQQIKELSQYLTIPPFKNFKFTSSREHYSLINNSLAIQCDREGKNIVVKNDKGYWFSIDNSLNLHEAEAIHPIDSQLDIIGIQKYFNEHKETKFEVTPKFILTSLKGMIDNANLYNQNISSHVEAIKQLGKGVHKLTRVMKGILIENQNLKLSSKHQTTLFDFNNYKEVK